MLCRLPKSQSFWTPSLKRPQDSDSKKIFWFANKIFLHNKRVSLGQYRISAGKVAEVLYCCCPKKIYLFHCLPVGLTCERRASSPVGSKAKTSRFLDSCRPFVHWRGARSGCHVDFSSATEFLIVPAAPTDRVGTSHRRTPKQNPKVDTNKCFANLYTVLIWFVGDTSIVCAVARVRASSKDPLFIASTICFSRLHLIWKGHRVTRIEIVT